MSREEALVRTFVELADTLVDDFDIVETLTLLADRCVEVLDVTASGIMVAGSDGELRVMASSSDAMRLLELFELQAREGPCVDAYGSGLPVVNQELTASGPRWPTFAPHAVDAGFRSAHALPMRLRGETIGALALFRAEAGSLGAADLAVAQALGDVATIAILQERAATHAQEVNDQLAHALNSRVVIEQAKGMVAEHAGVDMEDAFHRLRRHARNHNLRLADLARDVIEGTTKAVALDP